MQNVVNYPYAILNVTTGVASFFATYAEAEKALILLNTNADCYVVVDMEERCIEEIQSMFSSTQQKNAKCLFLNDSFFASGLDNQVPTCYKVREVSEKARARSGRREGTEP